MTIGIGIIGTGFARNVQIPAFLKCEGAAIVSVASGSFENAKSTADEFGIAHITGDWRETVSREDVDLVCVTTPPDLHRDITLAALENGKHVLCEKPMAMNVAEAKEMTEAAERTNLLALIDHELRFLPGRLQARDLLREGAIGKVRHAKCNFQAPHRGDPNIRWNWWSDAKQGGGALGAIGSHVIDSFRWFLSTEISSVFCQLQSQIKRRRTASGEMREVTSDDESLLVVRFANGELTEDATGLISLSMTEGPAYRHRVEFYGTEGVMAVDARGEIYLAGSGEHEWKKIDVDLGETVSGVADTGFARGFMFFAPKIVDAIRDRASSIEHAATFADGLEVQFVLDAARESNRTGQVVTVGRREASAPRS